MLYSICLMCINMSYKYIRKFLINKLGSFSTITVIIIPLIIMFSGFAFDVVNMFYVKLELNYILDRALMNTSEHLISSNKDFQLSDIYNSIKHNMNIELCNDFHDQSAIDGILNSLDIHFDKMLSQYSISVKSNYKMHMNPLNILRYSKNNEFVNIDVHSSTLINIKNNFTSIMFIVDVSSSMNSTFGHFWELFFKPSKLTITKRSINDLLNRIEKINSFEGMILVGGVTYNNSIVDVFPLNPSIKEFRKKINAIEASGGTDSLPAVLEGYNMLMSQDTTFGKKRHKYIIFMTDGNNNIYSQTIKTINVCDNAKKDGITIFTIAIDTGSFDTRLVKQCASAGDDYYAENSNDMNDIFAKIAKKLTDSAIRLIK
ncbi:MAG: hypothetical protein DBO98_05540 [Candidatus Liberibacter europaeus]|nr:hypothetical protein [Candidatus Liberibacter europaeus]